MITQEMVGIAMYLLQERGVDLGSNDIVVSSPEEELAVHVLVAAGVLVYEEESVNE